MYDLQYDNCTSLTLYTMKIAYYRLLIKYIWQSFGSGTAFCSQNLAQAVVAYWSPGDCNSKVSERRGGEKNVKECAVVLQADI
jgi:hypothetical protein